MSRGFGNVVYDFSFLLTLVCTSQVTMSTTKNVILSLSRRDLFLFVLADYCFFLFYQDGLKLNTIFIVRKDTIFCMEAKI